jgi:hypothetical protein
VAAENHGWPGDSVLNGRGLAERNSDFVTVFSALSPTEIVNLLVAVVGMRIDGFI